jgi:hypothetical protein
MGRRYGEQNVMLEFRKGSTRGIERCSPVELPAEFYSLTNRWTGTVNGKVTIVYAGALRHNPAKGVLVVRTLPMDAKRIAGKHCSLPTDGGALTILESRGSRLLIGCESGERFWFDVPGSLRAAA